MSWTPGSARLLQSSLECPFRQPTLSTSQTHNFIFLPLTSVLSCLAVKVTPPSASGIIYQIFAILPHKHFQSMFSPICTLGVPSSDQACLDHSIHSSILTCCHSSTLIYPPCCRQPLIIPSDCNLAMAFICYKKKTQAFYYCIWGLAVVHLHTALAKMSHQSAITHGLYWSYTVSYRGFLKVNVGWLDEWMNEEMNKHKPSNFDLNLLDHRYYE